MNLVTRLMNAPSSRDASIPKTMSCLTVDDILVGEDIMSKDSSFIESKVYEITQLTMKYEGKSSSEKEYGGLDHLSRQKGSYV